ncbi:rhodanese-like domain-containing protein [Acerihabitans arboris]|uniref:Sulfurtransferase n=1 Tax=Acerihabitans arboris TaxID=2691583 RepID=A0A845SQ11_9GAMM|nr:rhodanese-like domain-containing protein [Acerihabitans arboris]NDL65227.1 sulfurtransferase [Acerihabitans arboris]
MTLRHDFGRPVALPALLDWLDDGEELAFIDIREEGPYGEGHPLLAVNVPYSLLETALPPLVPRAGTRLVVLGDDAAVAARALERLSVLGYDALYFLAGGIQAWEQGGQPLFKGVNVPYKAFAEFVEHLLHTPDIAPAELARLIEQQEDYILLDSRTAEEYDRFHVPSAISVPSAELLYRFDDLVPSPDTLVVISCAGRTRGIIGAQTLINAGVPNKVVALSGGTQGWRLADLATVRDDARYFPPLSARAEKSSRDRAAKLAQRYGVRTVDAATLGQWQSDPERTTYLFDVRNHDEYLRGHRAGARWAPGGQLVQSLDKWAGTRNARIVLNDNDGVRATTTAHWLLQLGWDAVVLPGFDAAQASSPPPAPLSLPSVPVIDAATARQQLDAGALGLSADRSWDYRRAHPAGTRWVNRSRLTDALPVPVEPSAEILVFAGQGPLAEGVARDLIAAGYDAKRVAGKPQEWQAAGLTVQSSPQDPSDAQQIDYLFWVHDRHGGNAAASAAYLAWEADLPRQVADPAVAHFNIRS